MPNNFTFGDRVKITTGFLAGQTGIIQSYGAIHKPGHPNHGLPTATLSLDPAEGKSFRRRTQQLTKNLELHPSK